MKKFSTPQSKILVVDDEKGVRDLLRALLEKKGHEVVCLEDAESAMEVMAREAFELVITDLRLPGLSGEELVERLKKINPLVPVVVISGYGNTKNVVDVVKKGAEDYLSKPFTAEELELVVLKSLEKQRLLAENQRLRMEVSGSMDLQLVGRSRPMEAVLKMIQTFGPSEAHVLITGESGVGKELAARAIHENSTRAKGPLVQVNAGALTSSLFEAELFGVKQGAFTGAVETREGLFQAADGGTLFLDEIAEVPLESQAKLLRVLESGEIRQLGDSKPKKVKVRVIAATNQDLEDMVERKLFRKDLFYRLSVLLLNIPPLRERKEDIPLLSDFFLRRFFSKNGQTPKLSSEALHWLAAQNWPGNVRELRNALERAVLTCPHGEIRSRDFALTEGPGISRSGGTFREAKRAQVQVFEKEYLARLLRECGGNVSQAARQSGLARRNFQLLLKKYKLNPTSFRRQ